MVLSHPFLSPSLTTTYVTAGRGSAEEGRVGVDGNGRKEGRPQTTLVSCGGEGGGYKGLVLLAARQQLDESRIVKFQLLHLRAQHRRRLGPRERSRRLPARTGELQLQSRASAL
jgi:hypothetical protein